MKILQVCPRYYPFVGGVEEHVRNISERLVKKHDVIVATTDPSRILPNEEIINGVKVVRFKSWAPHESYFFSRQLRKYLIGSSQHFDIVEAHTYSAFPALYAVQAKGKNKLVFKPHYHGAAHTLFRTLLYKPYKFFGREIFEKADKVVCVSLYEKSLVLRDFALDEEKVKVIPNGVSLQEFKGLTKGKKGHPTILTVGRLERYKGIQYLIGVLPRLDRCTTLEVVGKGPYKRNLVGLSRKLNVASRVNFHQDLPRNELLQKYADASVFCLLSEHEAYGMSIAEALCAKTPCIVANASALREWIDQENCFGIDFPINLDTLRDLIGKVIGRQANTLRVLDWDEVVEKLLEVYKSC